MEDLKERSLFGDYLRKLRLNKGFSLRRFSNMIDIDPGNMSRIERGVFPSPSKEKLDKIVEVLCLKEGSEEWQNLMDYAYISKKEIPDKVLSDEELLKKLPLIFRSLTGSKLTSEELDKLVEMIRNAR